MTSEEITQVITLSREAGFTLLEQGRQLVEAAGIPEKTMFRESHPSLEIIRIARESNFNLIILGAKGVSDIKELLLGSTSEQIVRNAPYARARIQTTKS